MPGRRERWQRAWTSPASWACAGFLSLALAWWGWNVHGGPATAYHFMQNGDQVIYTWPTLHFLQSELQAGRIALWNPHQMAGQPLLAGMAAQALYLPNLALLALLPPARMLDVHGVLHIGMAGLFTWLLAGRLGLSRPARAAAGVSYALCPPVFHAFFQLAFLTAYAWLPVVFWALLGLLQRPGPRTAVALAVAVAAFHYAGYVQGWLYGVQVALLYGALGLWLHARPGERLRVLGWAAAAGLLCLGLMAPQLLPSVELSARAVRDLEGHDLRSAYSLGFELPTRMLRGTLGGLGEPRGSGGTWPLLALPVAGLAFFGRGHRRLAVVLAALALLLACFATGPNTPVFALYHALPLGDLFRVPARILFVYQLLVALLFALGVEQLGRLVAGRGPVWRWLPLVVVLVASAHLFARERLQYAHAAAVPPHPASPELVRRLEPDASRQRVFVEIPSAAANPRIPAKLGMLTGLRSVPDYEPALPGLYLEYFRSTRESWHGWLTWLGLQSEWAVPELRRLLDAMAVRHYVYHVERPYRALVAPRLERLVGAGPTRFSRGGAALERPEAVGRAHLVSCVETADDTRRAIERLTDADFPLGRSAVVRAAPEALPSTLRACRAPPPGPPRFLADTPRTVSLEAECSFHCLLVLADLDYPGWRATVDGEETAILRTNGIYRGVVLAPGRHVVRFDYAPASFRVGAALCGVALLVSGGLLFRGRRGAGALSPGARPPGG